MANPGSCVFFFTDADAKDPERYDELIHLVNNKNMRILYLLRDECHRRRRRRSQFRVPENVQCIKNHIIRRAGLLFLFFQRFLFYIGQTNMEYRHFCVDSTNIFTLCCMLVEIGKDRYF